MATPYRVLGMTILPLLRWRIQTVEGLAYLPNQGCIVVANHQSWLDSALLAAAIYRHLHRSIRFVAQSSKYRMFGGIPINEYDKSSVLDIAAGYLHVGHPIMIFPEGNSNPNARLRSGKTGAARLALRSGAPVVPIGIRGTRGVRAWQAVGWWLQWWRTCTIHIGKPLTFAREEIHPHEHDRLAAVTQQIMERISDLSGKPLAAETIATP